ncbi:YqcI/YcgG family protein [Pseudomonas sp. S75]|uniref:YqcI/YcgG family protein n=1 Tax=unclassified Pseudomonas TaxID=196821 RepID=UPI001908E4A7|nr:MULTISPECIES: YqcI/YcgG family protein [unclassified Pseudomonas]MBJ9975838.1 YqcI/YcgG family protein [Pseudomonas sp. S30]MBK0154578.1 YqcI/YcgG family protein [Pseudomonas sp. S75]
MFTGYGKCYRLDARELAEEHARNSQHWTCTTLQHFKAILDSPAFPCLFGRKAVAAGSCHVLFARAQDAANDIARGLADYIQALAFLPRKQRVGCPLLVFLETAAQTTLAEQQRLAWAILQKVHARDPHPWPQDVPRDPQDSQWSFCFAGMPLFINMSFPAHRQMKSRNLGSSIAFVINPRDSFDEVASAATESGQRIRARIRERVGHYNDGLIPQTLGFFGQDDNYEWQQYQLQEPGSLSPARCPFQAGTTAERQIEN